MDVKDFLNIFLNIKELLDGRVVSIVKKEYGSLVHFL